MVEVVTTDNGYPLLSDPEVDVAKTNHFYLKGPGFVSIVIESVDMSVNGNGVVITQSVELATKLGLQEIPINPKDVKTLALTNKDKFYRLPLGRVGDEKISLTMTEDL